MTKALGTPEEVVVKRFFTRTADGTHSRMAPADEYVRICAEGNLLYWAHALQELVYQYIDHIIQKKGYGPASPPYKFRFVNGAIALTFPKEGKDQHNVPFTKCMLLEERIPIPEGGKFTKYIGNGRAVILPERGEDGFHQAGFLSFCQHLQYVKTHKMAYISDYQGYGELLTDPQIMSSRDVTEQALFGDGNVSDAFDRFELEHECDYWCIFFELEQFSGADNSE